MTTAMRRFHQAAICIHFIGLCLFAYAYSLIPSAVFVVFAGWSILYGAQSTLALRKDGKGAVL